MAFVTVKMFIKTPGIHVGSKGLDYIFSLARVKITFCKETGRRKLLEAQERDRVG